MEKIGGLKKNYIVVLNFLRLLLCLCYIPRACEQVKEIDSPEVTVLNMPREIIYKSFQVNIVKNVVSQ